MSDTENPESTESPPTPIIDVGHHAFDAPPATFHLNEEGLAVAEADTRLSTPPTLNITPHEIVRRIGQAVTVNERGRFACPVCNMDFETPQALGPHFRLHWQEAGVALRDIPNTKDKRSACPECKMPLRSHSMVGHLVAKHQWDRAAATGYCRTAGFDLDAYLNPPPAPPAPEPKATIKVTGKAKVKPKHKVPYDEWQQQFVVCPDGECGAVHRRKYMKRHIEAVHGKPSQEAIDLTRSLPKSNHKKSVQSKTYKPGRPPQAKALVAALDVVEPNGVTPPPSDKPFTEGAPSGFDFTAISPTDIAIGVVQSQVNGTMPTNLLPDVITYVDHTRDLIDRLRASRAT